MYSGGPAKEVSPVPRGCRYLEGRWGGWRGGGRRRGGTRKNRETFNALLFWVHRGAEGPSVLVVFGAAPSESEGFYTSSVAA